MTPMGDFDPLRPWSDATGFFMSDFEVSAVAQRRAVAAAVRYERDRILALIEEIRISPQWSGKQTDWVCEVIVGEIGDGRIPLSSRRRHHVDEEDLDV